MDITKTDNSDTATGDARATKTVVVAHPSFGEALRFWLKLGFISFGGPAGQISIMYQELVEKRRWVSNERFLNALNYCMLLPGPEAQQLAAYLGWLLHRIPGGVTAGLLFLLPSMFILFALSYIYVSLGDIGWVSALFEGLKAAVMAIVVVGVIINLAVWFGLHVLIPVDAGFNWFAAVVGLASFIALHWGGLSIIKVILLAGGIGILFGLIGA